MLTQAEWLGALAALRDEALLSGFYVNELVLRLTEREDVHPGLFQSYVHVLSALADEDPAVRQTGLRSFEAELLAHCAGAWRSRIVICKRAPSGFSSPPKAP